eukprot:tig00020911_g15757.t1
MRDPRLANDPGANLDKDGQRIIYDLVLNAVLEQNGKEQLILLATGAAGVGKTVIVNALVKAIRQAVPFDKSSHHGPVAVCAPTGNASFLIHGITIHRFLHLSIGSPSAQMSNQLTSDLEREIGDVKVLIIDEISMVGARMLYCLDQRLRKARCKPDLMFGGIHVVFFGDFKQLQPVMDKPLYQEPEAIPSGSTEAQVEAQLGLHLWRQAVKKAVILTKVFRQTDTDDLYKILTVIRNALKRRAVGGLRTRTGSVVVRVAWTPL